MPVKIWKILGVIFFVFCFGRFSYWLRKTTQLQKATGNVIQMPPTGGKLRRVMFLKSMFLIVKI